MAVLPKPCRENFPLSLHQHVATGQLILVLSSAFPLPRMGSMAFPRVWWATTQCVS